MTNSSEAYLGKLHQLLNHYFNLSEIQYLCLQLNIDYESVADEEKASRIRSLLLGLVRNGRLPELITFTQQKRPNADWPPVPDDFELLESLETAVINGQHHVYGDVIQGDKFTGDKIGQDKIVVGDVSGQAAVAIGERAQATINQFGDMIIHADNFEDLPPAPGEPPYKGLTYFTEADKEIFFGREKLSDKLADKLQTTRFLTVIGASGSGKSSLLRAGIVPRLRARNWRIHIIKPGVHPMTALAASLTQDELDPTITDVIGNALTAHVDTLSKTAEKLATRTHAERLLLAVDQFEELFTQCKDVQEQQAFVDNLVNAAQAQGVTTVLLSMRADFYGRVSQYSSLTDLISQQQVYIKPMAEEELVRAIAEPAKHSGWRFVEGLVEQFVVDVGREPGRLPLLSHALLATWQRRRGVVLTLGGYRDAGGVKSAIAQTAEATYATLATSEQAIAKRIFLRLTELGKGTEDTRRRVSQVELGNGTVVQAVTQHLIAARLITTTQDDIDVAHEALIREWPRLRDWLNADREGLIIHRRLTDAEREWRNNEWEPSLLYSGFRLNEAEQWVKDNANALNDLEHTFFTASIAERQKREADEEAQRQRELKQAQALAAEQRQRAEEQTAATKRLRKRNMLFAGTAVFAVVLAVVALIFFGNAQSSAKEAEDNLAIAQTREAEAIAANATAEAERNVAQTQAAVAQSGSLAMSSLTLGHENDMRSLLLAIAAGKRADTILAFTALHTRLPFLPPRLQTFSHESGVYGATWNEDESQILTWSNGGKISLWAASGEQIHAFSYAGFGFDVAWNEDKSQILTWSDSTVVLWDAVSGKQLHTFSHEGVVYGAAWNEDESQILTWSNAGTDGTVSLWVVASEERLQTFSHEGVVYGAVWNEDEGQILTWGYDRTNGIAALWSALSGKQLQTFSHEGVVYGAAWNEDESQILTWSNAGTAGTVSLWVVASGERVQTFSHEGEVNGAVWNKDGTQILAWSNYRVDGEVTLWAFSGERLQTFSHNRLVGGAAWNEREDRILTWSTDGTAVLWAVASGEQIQTFSHENMVRGATWNEDESKILTWDVDGTVSLWAPKGKQFQSFPRKYWIRGAAWNKDKNQILTWSEDGTVVLSAASGELLQTFSHEGVVNGASWNEDESRILTQSGRVVTLWSATSGEQLQTYLHEDVVYGATWDDDESRILTWSWDGTAVLWNAANGKRLQTLSHEDMVHGAMLNGDENQTLTWSGSTAILWDVTSGEQLQIYPQEGVVYDAKWNEDESLILTQSGNTVVLWDAASGKQLRAFAHEGVANGTVWSKDESRLLTWSWDGTAALWDTTSGERLQLFSHEDWILDAEWNEDESQILIRSRDRTVALWDAVSGERLHTFPHDDYVDGATWNRDENQILTWSGDGTAKLWDAQTGQTLLIINPDDTPVIDAQWNQDEDRLLISTQRGTVRTYYTNMDELIDAACQVTTRNFTWNEWQLYFPNETYRCMCGQWPAGAGAPINASGCRQE